VGVVGAPVTEQQQQQQQQQRSQQQPISQPCDPQSRQSPDQQHSFSAELQPSIAQQPSSSSSRPEMHQSFDLAPFESFGIASDNSDGTKSESDEADHGDDQFWQNEFLTSDSAAASVAGSKRPAQLHEEGAQPEKRHRPG